MLDAAEQEFSAHGFNGALMTDIASRAGVAPGTIYHYFENKDALLYFVIERRMRGPEGTPPPTELPMTIPDDDSAAELIDRQLTRLMEYPVLDRARAEIPCADLQLELESIIGELYDGLARFRKLIDIVEISAVDLPEVSDIWFRKGRTVLIDQLTDYINHRVETGMIAPMANPRIAARFLVETCNAFARLRHHDPYPDSVEDEEEVRKTTILMTANSLIGGDWTLASSDAVAERAS